MADKRISQLIERVDIANNDVLPIVASGATTTNKVTISTIQDWMQSNLDVGVTSVGLTMPSAFQVSGSPITTSGNITVTATGTASQYIRGDGTLADFPQGGGGGGASVSYYLNGSVSQGIIGGVAYLEMNKTPVLGAGTNFTINANGYIASFITDVGDPGLLEIPGGNWNFETYFQASSGGGTPSFYIELYKVNSGGTATLIASNSANPELIAFGTTTTAYFSSLAVPTTTLAITDRLALRYYVTHSGRTITLHTENSNLCQIITTFTTGLTALNGLTAQVQNFATGTSGTDFSISSSGSIHTFNLPTASATNRGLLSAADWSTFNGKQNSITLTTSGTSGAATLVGSTLNIPNYSTGVANAYVPYVGAIGSVTLGYNSLSASQINIDGASPTGGSYLGFKHSTSVNTGTDGYTSIYTFGTNTIAFKSVSGGNSKDFSFSMVGITPNVAGGRQYTLPDASGTLALTSDLGNYIQGSGTADSIPKFTGTRTLANSAIRDTTSTVVISKNVSVDNGASQAINLTPASGGTTNRIETTGTLPLSLVTSGSSITLAAGGVTPQITLTSAGNVGIGVTPSAWSGIVRGFQVGQGASFSANTATTDAYMTSNCYYDGSTWRYIKSGEFALSYDARGGTGDYVWQTAPSGTAGAAFTFTDRFRISSTGAATFSSSVSGTSIRSSAVGSFGFNTANNGEFQIYATAASGMIMAGRGSSNDMVITNKDGSDVFRIPTGTTIANFTGNVGIGTTSPSARLDVAGKIRATDDLILAQTNPVIAYDNGSTGALRFASDGGNTERMRITSGGNVGIGTASPVYKFEVSDGTRTGVFNPNSVFDGFFIGIKESKPLVLGTGDAERMRITSGGFFLVNTTDVPANTSRGFGIGIDVSGTYIQNRVNTTASYGQLAFFNPNGLVGQVVTSGSSTSYNTSSDYRLKENVKPVENALSVLTQLKPCTFNFIADTDEEVMGFIAHEVQEVMPQAVTGEKDAVRIEQVEVSPAELDEEGNVITEAVIEEKEVPVYQGIDHSKLVPLLVAAIQEQQEQIKSLTEQVEALKSQING